MQPPVIPPPLPSPPPLSAGEHAPLLLPHELERFRDFLVFARSTVEGYFNGKHKSPYRGSSAEFAEYKEYVVGEDTSRIDWRVYGRSRRLCVRQFEEETDMTVYLMVDTSASMRYRGRGRPSKHRLGCRVAAALAYLMINQGDKASLVLFADSVRRFVAPGGTRRHLHQLISELEHVQPSAGTGLVPALTECSSLFRKRGRIVILSDFLVETEPLLEALGRFLHRKYEILLLQVVDPDELNLPAVSVAKFVDLETAEEIQAEPDEIRRGYREQMQRFIDTLGREASARQITHALVNTEHPYLDAIEAYLGFRGSNTLFAR